MVIRYLGEQRENKALENLIATKSNSSPEQAWSLWVDKVRVWAGETAEENVRKGSQALSLWTEQKLLQEILRRNLNLSHVLLQLSDTSVGKIVLQTHRAARKNYPMPRITERLSQNWNPAYQPQVKNSWGEWWRWRPGCWCSILPKITQTLNDSGNSWQGWRRIHRL